MSLTQREITDKAQKYLHMKLGKKKRKAIAWKLMRMCHELGVTVSFAFHEIDDRGEYAHGDFDSTEKHITIYKSIKSSDVTTLDLFTLSHEYIHAIQFDEGMEPDAWMYYADMMFEKPKRACSRLERDADSRAVELLDNLIATSP